MVAPVSPQLLPSVDPEAGLPPSVALALVPLPATPGGDVVPTPGTTDLMDKMQYAQRVLAPFLPKPERPSKRAIKNYMTVLSTEQPPVGDIDTVLRRLRNESSPLERGVVGPTGASATVSFSVLGPIFGLYGFGAGCKIIHTSRKAQGYLTKLDTELKAREAELQALKKASADKPDLQLTIAELEQRIFILQEFRRGVQLSVSEQRFNMAFPGFVQLTASSLICTLAVDLAPTLGGGTAVFSAAATLGFGVTASAVLGVYAAGSLVKNGYQFAATWNTPTLAITEADPKEMQQYKKLYNQRLIHQSAFYGLNSIAWGAYVAGAGLLIATLAGSVALHGIPEVLVVGGALAAVIWDVIWGKEFAPHNTLTPHIDRNYLNTIQKRVDVWKLLKMERGELEATIKQALNTLPRSHKPKPAGWQNLPLELRYKYFWQFLPATVLHGGNERFARWCIRDATLMDPIMLDHMKNYTDAEISYQQNKVIERTGEVVLRVMEFSKAREAGNQVNYDTLQGLLMQDGLALQHDELKLGALQELRVSMESVNVTKAHQKGDDNMLWNKVRLQYLSVHGLLDNFIDRYDLLVHPTWFAYQAPEGRGPTKRYPKIHNKQITRRGLRELSTRGFTPEQEKRFIHSVADLDSNRYETHTIFGMERAAQKKKRKEEKKTELTEN